MKNIKLILHSFEHIAHLSCNTMVLHEMVSCNTIFRDFVNSDNWIGKILSTRAVLECLRVVGYNVEVFQDCLWQKFRYSCLGTTGFQFLVQLAYNVIVLTICSFFVIVLTICRLLVTRNAICRDTSPCISMWLCWQFAVCWYNGKYARKQIGFCIVSNYAEYDHINMRKIVDTITIPFNFYKKKH